MRLWIDCEWNDYKGDLISMALVAENGSYWYQTLEVASPTPWVKQHVLPNLLQPPTNSYNFQASLGNFLRQYDSVHLIADWPEDIAHFCNTLITGPGKCLLFPRLTIEVCQIDSTSTLPHNALQDALANKTAYLEQEKDKNGR